MTGLSLTEGILRQAKTPVRAIEALGTIKPTGLLERAAAADRRGGARVVEQ
jgi:hypothetical protein